MHFIPIKVTVTTAGTVVNLVDFLPVLPADVLDNGKCHGICLYPATGNTGIGYVGLTATARGGPGVTMVKATSVGVLKELYPPASTGIPDEFCKSAPGNSINPNDFAFDASANAQKFVGHLMVL